MRTLIADDHSLIRRGLREIVEAHAGWSVCGEAATGQEAVALSEQLRPDVATVDFVLPRLDGLEVTRRIRRVSPVTQVLLVTLHFSEQLLRDAIVAGVRGYILKSDSTRDLARAIETLEIKRPFFTASATHLLMDPLRSVTVNNKEQLTSRETQVVKLLCEGNSSKEVATAIGISVKTAETHRANLMRKLKVHSVADLVRYAVRNKMIDA